MSCTAFPFEHGDSNVQPLFINGQQSESQSGETLPVHCPQSGAVIARIQRGNGMDIDRAVQAARASLSGDWGAKSALERGRILSRVAALTLEHMDELAAIEALDTGKPPALARNDIAALARYFEFYAGAADKVHGEVLPYLEGYAVSVVKEPYGVVGHIIPWNYPAQMLGRTIAPALVMGNACVVKPAEEACLTALRFAQIAKLAGLPDGALNIVSGLGSEAGAALSEHPDINLLTFTGSPAVGTLIQSAAAKNHIKCVLELGGKSPQIVFEDADLDAAIPAIVNGIVQNAGQTCSAGSRVLIHKNIAGKFIDRIAAEFRSMTAGPSDTAASCGPIITRKQYHFVQDCIESARKRGIPVIAEGRLHPSCDPAGSYIAPILLGPVDPCDFLAREEIFGPVLTVLEFECEGEAIELANGTDFGLVAGVWTESGRRQQRLARQLQCGQVFINCFGAGGGVELPFGGVKKSGHGREKGLKGLEEFCVTKTVVNRYIQE